jgi:hypothetical protein
VRTRAEVGEGAAAGGQGEEAGCVEKTGERREGMRSLARDAAERSRGRGAAVNCFSFFFQKSRGADKNAFWASRLASRSIRHGQTSVYNHYRC